MSNYPVPPPAYADATAKKAPDYGTAHNETEPILNAGPSFDDDDDIPDDFKIGVTVAQSHIDIRNMFIRKVYTVLFLQILLTSVVAVCLRSDSAKELIQTHPVLTFIIPMIGTFMSMGFVFYYRHSHPANLISLGLFTLFEAAMLGLAIVYVDMDVILQAFVITLVVFLGLTLFTMQSRYNFDNMAPYLATGLMVMLATSLMFVFLPQSRTVSLVFSGFGCLLFSGYIVYDTHLLMNRLHIDDWAVACVSLYLDILNLFLSILRILNDAESN